MAPSNFSGIHLIDGGLSTELERIGVAVSGELWTGQALLNNPTGIEQAHRNYATAGAEVVITSSYQLSRQGFREIGLTDAEADSALRRSVEVARAAVAGTDTKVAASVGPYGAVLHDGSEYRGDYLVSQAQLEDFHFERLQVLVNAGPDLLAVETIPNVSEAKALAAVLKEFDVPRWISFTAGTGTHLWSDEPFEEAVAAVSQVPHLLAVGMNCVDPMLVASLASIANNTSGLPVIAYPNRGGTWDSQAGEWLGAKPADFSELLPSWIEAGVRWVGGCCGTHSGDISSLRLAITA